MINTAGCCESRFGCVGSSVVTFLCTPSAPSPSPLSSKTLLLKVLRFHQTGPSLLHREYALTSCCPKSLTSVPILVPHGLSHGDFLNPIARLPQPTLPSCRLLFHATLPPLCSPLAFPWKHVQAAPLPHLYLLQPLSLSRPPAPLPPELQASCVSGTPGLR